MIQIFQYTPIWVFILFFFLLYLGFSQTKDKTSSIKKAIILPIVMLFISLIGLINAFGLDIKSLFFYTIGTILGIFIAILFKLPRNSTFIIEKDIFFIKGSFIPFLLILAIFFLKYFVGVVTARELDFINSFTFIFTISFLYGLFCGIFFGRLFVLLEVKKLKGK